MKALVLIIGLYSMQVFAASANPKVKIEAVPAPGKTKVELINSVPPETDLIKTEKTIVDKSCRLIHGKMKCKKNRPVKRKTID